MEGLATEKGLAEAVLPGNRQQWQYTSMYFYYNPVIQCTAGNENIYKVGTCDPIERNGFGKKMKCILNYEAKEGENIFCSIMEGLAAEKGKATWVQTANKPQWQYTSMYFYYNPVIQCTAGNESLYKFGTCDPIERNGVGKRMKCILSYPAKESKDVFCSIVEGLTAEKGLAKPVLPGNRQQWQYTSMYFYFNPVIQCTAGNENLYKVGTCDPIERNGVGKRMKCILSYPAKESKDVFCSIVEGLTAEKGLAKPVLPGNRQQWQYTSMYFYFNPVIQCTAGNENLYKVGTCDPIERNGVGKRMKCILSYPAKESKDVFCSIVEGLTAEKGLAKPVLPGNRQQWQYTSMYFYFNPVIQCTAGNENLYKVGTCDPIERNGVGKRMKCILSYPAKESKDVFCSIVEGLTAEKGLAKPVLPGNRQQWQYTSMYFYFNPVIQCTAGNENLYKVGTCDPIERNGVGKRMKCILNYQAKEDVKVTCSIMEGLAAEKGWAIPMLPGNRQRWQYTSMYFYYNPAIQCKSGNVDVSEYGKCDPIEWNDVFKRIKCIVYHEAKEGEDVFCSIMESKLRTSTEQTPPGDRSPPGSSFASVPA
ncbi:uncharacterized protein [Eleutherodactylus coqui]|uniref:uncharacterized protein isoform X2 n=1 Tax=Eleutherodactylus coqui TaxID=57060 RepID=UPI0034629597